MAIALDDLKSLLENGTNKIFSDGAETLLFPFCHAGHAFQVMGEIMEDGAYVRFHIPWLLDLNDALPREAMLVRLLDLNRRLKILKFGFDPSDGEVSVSVELPLEDGALTERQAYRCMYMLTDTALRERDNLLTLIRTGVYPGSCDPAFTDAIGRLLPRDEVAVLEAEYDAVENTDDI